MKHIMTIILALAFLSGVADAAEETAFSGNLLAGVEYRNIGPFRAGGWVSDIAVPEKPQTAHLYTMYIATRSGGLWKTTNNGTTFEPIFDDQSVSSIGTVTLAPSNPEIVWVGTGGADNARSTYYGDGVYKLTDGGKTWVHMGLEDSHHVARIVIHPEDSERGLRRRHGPSILEQRGTGRLQNP